MQRVTCNSGRLLLQSGHHGRSQRRHVGSGGLLSGHTLDVLYQVRSRSSQVGDLQQQFAVLLEEMHAVLELSQSPHAYIFQEQDDGSACGGGSKRRAVMGSSHVPNLKYLLSGGLRSASST